MINHFNTTIILFIHAILFIINKVYQILTFSIIIHQFISLNHQFFIFIIIQLIIIHLIMIRTYLIILTIIIKVILFNFHYLIPFNPSFYLLLYNLNHLIQLTK